MRISSFLSLGLLFLLSCATHENNPVNPQEEKILGDMSFSMSLNELKTTMNIQVTSVKVTLSGPTVINGELTLANDSSSASGTFNNLPPGTYNISIVALSNADTVATGSGSAVVNPGSITVANITLSLLPGGITVNVSWSFSNGLIVYARKDSGIFEIWKMNSDGTNNLKIVDLSEGPVFVGLGLSPDRTRIAFAAGSTNNYNIYVMNIDGTGKAQVTSQTASFLYYYGPMWKDNNRLFVSIARNGNEGKRDVIEMDADGTNIVWLTQTSTRSIHLGGLSPNGAKVVFDEGNPYASATTEVYVADYPTFANKIQIANPENPGAEGAGGWNANNLITFWGLKVYTVQPDGTGLDTLTTGPDAEWAPQFSPDGNKILFSSNPGGVTTYYIMNTDGTGRTFLLAGSATSELLQYSWR